ncbi:hypothetical protein [Streptomyces sp. NPDC002346]
MIYKLSDGIRVRVTREGDVTQFETYRFTPEKEVVSIETLTGDEAENLIRWLTVQDAIRFVRVFGSGPSAVVAQLHDAGEDMVPAPYFRRASDQVPDSHWGSASDGRC